MIKKHFRALRNNYLPVLLAVLMTVCALTSQGQVYQTYPQVGGQWKRLMVDSTLGIPHGPVRSLRGGTNGASIFFQTSDTTLQIWTGTQWISYSGSQNVYVDTVYLRGDSVFYRKSGFERFIYKVAGTGTVTSVAAGTGMYFSTITGTGTVDADTSVLATKGALKKARDSVQTNVNAKLNITDTTGKWVTTTYKKAGTDSIFQNKGGTITFLYRVDSSGAGGSPNTSVGSGYKVAINGTNNVKSLTAGINVLIDSSTTNQVNISADTTTGATKLATQGDIDRALATNDTLRTQWPLYGIAGGSNPDTIAIHKFTGSDSGYMTPAMWALKLNVTDTSGKWIARLYKKAGTDSIFMDKGGTLTYLFRTDSTGGGGSYTASKSVLLTGSDFTLVNDSSTIVNNRVYAYNGTRGWKPALMADSSGIKNGSLFYWNGTNVVPIAPGTSSQILHGGTTPVFKDTTAAGSGGVSISDSTLKWVTKNGDSTIYRVVTSDTLKGGGGFIHGKTTMGDAVRTNKTAVFYGHSVVYGVGVPYQWLAYPKKTADLLGFTTLNRGISGTTVRHHSAGDSCLLDRVSSFPPWTSNIGAVLLNYDINDANASYGFDTTGYKTDYAKAIDTLLIVKHVPADSLFILSANYVDTSVTNNYDNIRHFVRASRTVAENKGVGYIDLFYPMEASGGSIFLSDEDHPNTLGTDFISGLIAKNMGKFKKVGDLLVNGGGNFQDTTRFVGAVRIGANDTTTVDNIQPDLTVSGRTYLGSKVYFNTKSDFGSNSWVNIAAQTNLPGIHIRDGNPYNSLLYAGSLQQNSFGGTTTFHGIGVSTDQTVGFKLIGNGGNAYFLNLNNLSAFGATGLTTGDLDSVLKVKGSFHVTGNVRLSGIPSGVGTKAIRYDPSTGRITYADTTAAGGSGETNTASNLGVTTYGLYKQKVGADLQFKSLTAGTGISLTSNTNDVQIGVSIDTTNISGFAAKVRSLFSVGSFMTYNSATGLFGLDTTIVHSKNYYDARYAFAGAGGSYTGSQSITLTGSNFTLTNDSSSFVNSRKVYGVQNGTRGWKDAIVTNLTSPATGDVLTYQSSDTTLVNTSRPAFLLYNNYRSDTVVTTDATQTTIATIATAGSGYYSQGTLEITLDASSANAGISGSRIYRFVNNGGTMTIVDVTETAADYLSTLTTASWTVTVSGNNLLVKVTGQASQTLNWITLSKIHWSQTAL